MSVMNPILRIRNVVRSIGATSNQADEFADAMDAYPTKDDFQQKLDAMFAQQFNRLLLAMIVVGGLIVGLVTALN